ncbi:MAG: hypothetical protein JW731_07735 [Bacteroidales bacterium]|nr:hypothetical protein [Bacteroidales bacterium]
MPTDWKKIAEEIGNQTDEQFRSSISSLIRLNDDEIENLINETGISRENLVKVLEVVRDATKTNSDKATAINNINKGMSLLVGLAGKFL